MMYSGMLRHRNPELCGWGGFALHEFEKYHILGEPFPLMDKKQGWLQKPVYSGDNGERISYFQMYNGASKCWEKVELTSQKKTHVRAAAARMANMLGCSEEALERAGNWGTDVLEQSYLTNLPLEALKALAGFAKDEDHFLPRDLIEPPKELAALLWPEADRWLKKHQEGKVEGGKPVMAAIGFCKLMIKTRKILLQDAAILMERYPLLEIWQHPIFQCASFSSFAAQQRAIIARTPEVYSRQQRVDIATENRLYNIESKVDVILDLLKKQSVEQPDPSTNFAPASPPHLLASPNRPFLPVPEPSLHSPPSPNSNWLPSSPPQDPAAAKRQYKLSGAKTVGDLWREWYAGVNGWPALSDIYKAHKNAAFINDTNRRRWQRRKDIIELIKIKIQKGISMETAVLQTEALRGKASLNLFNQKLFSSKKKFASAFSSSASESPEEGSEEELVDDEDQWSDVEQHQPKKSKSKGHNEIIIQEAEDLESEEKENNSEERPRSCSQATVTVSSDVPRNVSLHSLSPSSKGSQCSQKTSQKSNKSAAHLPQSPYVRPPLRNCRVAPTSPPIPSGKLNRSQSRSQERNISQQRVSLTCTKKGSAAQEILCRATTSDAEGHTREAEDSLLENCLKPAQRRRRKPELKNSSYLIASRSIHEQEEETISSEATTVPQLIINHTAASFSIWGSPPKRRSTVPSSSSGYQQKTVEGMNSLHHNNNRQTTAKKRRRSKRS
uniref:Uncharacterized protein n=1 Tax=Heterosigma akashiwo TaxID=2829 RepID=A0A7S3UU98_HETAK